MNPATGSVFAQAPTVTPDQLDGVFAGALTAFDGWRRDEQLRRSALAAAADVLDARAAELAAILTEEQGKPLQEAEGEFRDSAEWLRYYATLETSPEIIRDDDHGYEAIARRPLGVVSAITPWNYPITLAMWKIAPALRAGNTIVVKPASYTPFSTLAVGEVLRGVLPDGVLNVVTGPEPLGSAMVSHPVPRKVSFTGSTAVGKLVARNAIDDLKRTTLELGGNDPAIVLEDADVNQIAESLFWGAFTNNGQICLAIKRVYAHERVAAQLIDALAALADGAHVGDGMDPGVELGPVNNEPQLEAVRDLVSDALGSGARIAAGGRGQGAQGYFFRPTILDNVQDGVRIVDEEQFGPVLPVVTFRDERAAIASANAGRYGLTASVWSSDPERAFALADEIEAGQVSVNEHGRGVQPHLPFGGWKWSGVGVENGPWGLHEYTQFQVVSGPPRPADGNPSRRRPSAPNSKRSSR